MERELKWGQWKIKIVKSRRKTLSLSVREENVILAKAPYGCPVEEVLRFAELKKNWIGKQSLRIRETRERSEAEGYLTDEEIKTLTKMAKKVLPERVAHYAEILGVTYGRITIRHQRSLWGSCSAAGNLNFNFLLMLAPASVADYVVVHELCHRFEMNHSARFWARVERVMPDWRERRAWLKTDGEVLLKRLTGR